MPGHNQPVYLYEPFTVRGYEAGICPLSEKLWREQIFRLPLNLGMTQEEIAEVLGCPVGTVASRKHLAVQRLTKSLSAVGAELLGTEG